MKIDPEFNFLPERFDLEPELREQLGNRPGSQRCLVGEDELLLVLHKLPEPGIPERDALIFWCDKSGVWSGPGELKGLGSLCSLLDDYQEVVDEYERVIDEDNVADAVFKVARHAGPMARSSRNLVAALDQAVAHDDDNRELMDFRDRAREIERAVELVYHDAKLVLDFRQAEHAEEQQLATERLNRIAFRLNLVAGFFLPLVAVAGLLGMNVEIPDFVKSWFWAILAGGLILGLLVVLMVGLVERTKS